MTRMRKCALVALLLSFPLDAISYPPSPPDSSLLRSVRSRSRITNPTALNIRAAVLRRHSEFRIRRENCNDNEGRLGNENTLPKVCGRRANSVRWKIGEWGGCLVSDNSTGCRENWGKTSREVICVYDEGRGRRRNETLPDRVCSALLPKPAEERKCRRECPRGCVVSEYGEWTGCGDCVSNRRTRTRRVLVAPEEGGRLCPSLAQSEECPPGRSCPQKTLRFLAVLGGWSSCQSEDVSGWPRVGRRTRNVSCIDARGRVVPSNWCKNHLNHLLRVSLIESCIVPRDCRVSEWSQWTTVGEGCITSDGHVYPEHRRRRRRIEKLPEGEGAPCPPLVERKSVRDGLASCDSEFKWVRSAWSRCIPEGKTCGGGLQTRIVLCMRNKDLKPVEASNCKEIRPPSMQQCNVECAKKCTVSEWSLWSTCLPVNVRDPLKSTTGYRKRTREILRKPSGIHECPWLVEVKFCREPEVVRWVTGNWSSCRLHDVTQPCGQGVMKREAICINPKGKHVSSSLCQMHVLPPKLLAPCYVPCPRDCVLAEWTEWSSCKAECNSEEKEEVRTRRRRVIAEHGSGK
ncbi:thrombospondin type-1 domain-containing protein 7B-like [Centruroides vittatus]|uniref:thrombospondin type-1 domain-containing protein 7B-like n=1 Tax=Centruroides vittatus TaxID=120091 RepID=UPI00350FC104